MAAQVAFGTDFYDRSILRLKHRAYYRSGRPVIKICPKGALGSHEIRPIHSAPSLGQSIVLKIILSSQWFRCLWHHWWRSVGSDIATHSFCFNQFKNLWEDDQAIWGILAVVRLWNVVLLKKMVLAHCSMHNAICLLYPSKVLLVKNLIIWNEGK